MSMFRQGVIVAFVLGSMLNAWGLIGTAGGYKYYANVSALDLAGAERFALVVELTFIVLAAIAWLYSRPKRERQ